MEITTCDGCEFKTVCEILSEYKVCRGCIMNNMLNRDPSCFEYDFENSWEPPREMEVAIYMVTHSDESLLETIFGPPLDEC